MDLFQSCSDAVHDLAKVLDTSLARWQTSRHFQLRAAMQEFERVTNTIQDLEYRTWKCIDCGEYNVRPEGWAESMSCTYCQMLRVPVYAKVHRDHLLIDTLRYYALPWEYDRVRNISRQE